MGPGFRQTANARVPFPPPLAYFVGMGLGFALQSVRPLSIAASASGETALRLAGAGVVVLAVALVVSAVVAFRAARTTPYFSQASTSLIVRGPFRISRNPVYVAGALVHIGVSFLANALWPLLFLPPALAVVNLLIKREESYLRKRFADE